MDRHREDRLFTLVSRVATGMTMLFITILWNKVAYLDQEVARRDKDLAKYFLVIETRLTRVEVKLEEDK